MFLKIGRTIPSYQVTAPEPNTWREVLDAIDQNDKTKDLASKTIAIQEYGESNKELLEALKQRGAKTIKVPVYRWARPDDTRTTNERNPGDFE